MLQNLRPDKKKEAEWRRWSRRCNKGRVHEKKRRVLGFKRFSPYSPTGLEYVKDFESNFNGVFIYKYGIVWPFNAISTCTRSYSDGHDGISGLCDNASQVIDLYNALFTGSEYHGNPKVLEMWKYNRELDLNSIREHPNGKWAQRRAKFWKGNHVIIMFKMEDFRWHKWGCYIGDFDHKHEYFSEEDGIDQVYYFEIFKVV